MTNNELKQIFEIAEAEADNIFDIYDFLINYEEEYKNTRMAKIKPTIYDAYELYQKSKSPFEGILDMILTADYSKITEQFDLEKLFNQIPDQYKELILQTLDEIKIGD